MNKYFSFIYLIGFCFLFCPFIISSSTSSDMNSLQETSDLIAKKEVSKPAKKEDTTSFGTERKGADIEDVNDIEEMNEKTQREIEEKRKLKQEQQKNQRKTYTNRSGFIESEKTDQNDIDSRDFSDTMDVPSNESSTNEKDSSDKDSLITDDIPDYNVEDDNSNDDALEKDLDSNLDMNSMEMEMKSDPNEKDDFTDYDKLFNDEFNKERSDSGVDYQDDSFYETPEPASEDPLDSGEFDSSFGTGF